MNIIVQSAAVPEPCLIESWAITIWLRIALNELVNALFCYPCTLLHPDGSMDSVTTGVTDMHHLSEKVKKHETSKMHMNSCLKFSVFGRINIATQLSESHRLAVHSHNNEVIKNRHILARCDCVKFCEVFELALRGKDETEGPLCALLRTPAELGYAISHLLHPGSESFLFRYWWNCQFFYPITQTYWHSRPDCCTKAAEAES